MAHAPARSRAVLKGAPYTAAMQVIVKALKKEKGYDYTVIHPDDFDAKVHEPVAKADAPKAEPKASQPKAAKPKARAKK